MPPRGHSSSSHHSSSSFRSSGSSFRSSGSSFRGPSSHSSSSHSSSSFSSRSSSSKPSSFKGPSAHAASSYTSAPAKPPVDFARRPRVNQPTGFTAPGHQRPTYYYGRRHSYIYYPIAWVDRDTGVSYQQGYYDENGQRYDSVTFEENGKYKNVVCHCPYCEQETIMDLSAGEVAEHSLKCPSCGGTMEIRSELDAVLSESSGEASQSSCSPDLPTKKKSRGTFWIILAMLLMVMSVSRFVRRMRPEPEVVLPSTGSDIQQISVIQGIGSSVASNQNVAVGAPVYLEKQSDGSYHVVTDVVRADKILYYEAESDSYYDEATECWLWKNTDMNPAVWQYWYEGISSDYGDYGWMEHDSTGWYIEKSAGNWISLPGKYDTSGLWYIE